MESYKVSSYESCTNVECVHTPYPTEMKVYVPKYMPNVTSGDWKQRVSIAGNIFVNASECAPSVPNIVTEQGYCTVKPYANEIPDFTGKFNFPRGYIPKGNTFLIEVMYEDCETRKLTGKV